ncbi:MAG TPA: type IV pilus assembly protein PilM [Dissulfurispiraceae bacterium]|nr:type IV pilus assembly protein PilM [Dissulfurispiraceae bacterium]
MLIGKKSVVGLDIGSRYLKIAQVNADRNGYELGLFSMLPVERDVIGDGLILNKPKLVDSLKALMSNAGIKKADAVIGLSGHSSVITKVIKVPLITEEELSLNIKYEAEQYIPFDIKDVNIDFEILGPDSEEGGMMNVMLVAVKKSVMSDYVDVAQQAGMQPIVVDIDSFAVGNVYETNYGVPDKNNIALVNIGASKTNISILRKGQPVFMRDTAIGSNYHAEALERTLNISKDVAESVKIGEVIEGVSQESAREIIGNASDEIYAEIYRSFEYFRSSVGDEDINGIVLSGGAALIKGFPQLMSERLGIPVEVNDVFKKIKLSDKAAPAVKDIAPIAAVVTGLAIRRAGDRQ